MSTALLRCRGKPLPGRRIPLLAAMLVVLVVFPAPVVAAPPVGAADVYFRPASVATAVGGLFIADAVVDAATEVEGAQVVVVYDPAHLEVVSVEPTGPLIHHLRTENDAAAGRLFYAAGALGGRFPSGSFPLLRLTFRLKAAPAGPLAVSIPRESLQRTIIAAAGTNVLRETRPLTVAVDPTSVGSSRWKAQRRCSSGFTLSTTVYGCWGDPWAAPVS